MYCVPYRMDMWCNDYISSHVISKSIGLAVLDGGMDGLADALEGGG